MRTRCPSSASRSATSRTAPATCGSSGTGGASGSGSTVTPTRSRPGSASRAPRSESGKSPTASRKSAASPRSRVRQPGVERSHQPPLEGIVPWVGLNPGSPQQAAGMRIEPAPSLAVAIGTIPAATAAADPPDDPPGVRARASGLRVIP